MIHDGTDNNWLGQMSPSENITIENAGGRVFEASIWIYITDNYDGGSIRLTEGGAFGSYDTDGDGIDDAQFPEEHVFPDMDITNEWQLIKSTITIPEGQEEVTGRYYIYHGNPYTSANTFIYVDNFQLREVLNTESVEYDTTEEAEDAYNYLHP